MQTVFVTIEEDAKGAQALNEVFCTYLAAEMYVIRVLFAHDERYSGQTLEYLRSAAADRIYERRVLGSLDVPVI